MIQFMSHASGSSGNLCSVTDGQSRLLIECGLRIKEIRRALGFSLSSVSGALLSHDHGDHAKAADDVMKAGADLYTSAGTAQALGLSGHRLHIIRALEQFHVGPWTILPFDTRHDAPEPLSFLIAHREGERLLYVTDTAYVPYRFKGLTIIAIEANYSMDLIRQNVASGAMPLAHKNRVMRNHMSLERLLDFLRANDLSQVRELHLLHLSDANADAELFRRRVQELAGKPVYVAQK